MLLFFSILVWCFVLFSILVLSSEANEMERVELGCSGGGKEYGSITTLLRGEVSLNIFENYSKTQGGGWLSVIMI